MKKYFFVLVALLASVCSIFAQSDSVSHKMSDYDRIAIAVLLPTNLDCPQEAAGQLSNKLQRIISNYGMVDNGTDNRFVITAKINILEKNIMQTTPVKIAQKMTVTLFIGDAEENRIFANTEIAVQGIGATETKSFIQAFNRINVNNPEIAAFIDRGKQKIGEYYEANCDFIMQEANRMAQNEQYNEAMAKLLAVPNVCSTCYQKANEQAMVIYQAIADKEGEQLLRQAQTAWYLTEDASSAEKALDFLLKVNPRSSSRAEADKLVLTIKKKLRYDEAAAAAARAKAEEEAKAARAERIAYNRAIEERNWNFKVRQYEDNMAMENRKQDLAEVQEANRTMLIGQFIGSAEKVGVAFGENQKEKHTHIINKW